MALVYKHRRLDNYDIFYVGISSDYSRPYVKNKRSDWWKKIVKKAGYQVEIVSENLPWEYACELEIDLIAAYGRRDRGKGTLVNMTDGGEGNFGFIPPSCKETFQYDLEGNFIKSFPSSLAAERALNITGVKGACRGIIKTAGGFMWRDKEDSNTPVVHIDENLKAVSQYTLNKVFIRNYKSIKEAKDYTNIQTQNIGKVCKGYRSKAGGFIWRYKEDSVHSKPNYIKKIPIEVLQYDFKGNLINTFVSAKKAGRDIGISSSHISSVCNNKHKTAGGFIWKYKNTTK